MNILNSAVFGQPYCLGDHPLRNVDGRDAGGAFSSSMPCEISEPTTEIQNAEPLQVRQKGMKRGHLENAIKACIALTQVFVPVKKHRVVIDIMWWMMLGRTHWKPLPQEGTYSA
jgi:hypothetical protein